MIPQLWPTALRHELRTRAGQKTQLTDPLVKEDTKGKEKWKPQRQKDPLCNSCVLPSSRSPLRHLSRPLNVVCVLFVVVMLFSCCLAAVSLLKKRTFNPIETFTGGKSREGNHVLV